MTRHMCASMVGDQAPQCPTSGLRRRPSDHKRVQKMQDVALGVALANSIAQWLTTNQQYLGVTSMLIILRPAEALPRQLLPALGLAAGLNTQRKSWWVHCSHICHSLRTTKSYSLRRGHRHLSTICLPPSPPAGRTSRSFVLPNPPPGAELRRPCLPSSPVPCSCSSSSSLLTCPLTVSASPGHRAPSALRGSVFHGGSTALLRY